MEHNGEDAGKQPFDAETARALARLCLPPPKLLDALNEAFGAESDEAADMRYVRRLADEGRTFEALQANVLWSVFHGNCIIAGRTMHQQ